METVYLLVPLAALLVVAIVVGFLWAVRSGQFDDLEGPAHRILMDDDDKLDPTRSDPSDSPNQNSPSSRSDNQ